MIKNLKRKIVISIMLIIGIVTIIFSSGLAIYNCNKIKNDVFVSLEKLVTQEPFNEGPRNDEKFISTSSFDTCIIKYNNETKETTIIQNDLDISDSNISTLIQTIISSKQKEGYVNDNNLIFVCKHQMENDNIVFANKDIITKQQLEIILICLTITIVFLVAIFFISIIVSNLVAKPVIKSIEQQKRFVADASHELKTPLAVIMANNKILEKTATKKQKEWIACNNDEIKHMSEIISDMLTLVKTESSSHIDIVQVDISKLCTNIFLEFEPIAYEKNIKFESKIDDNLSVNYDKKMLKQLIMILIDNAIKHEQCTGEVLVTLTKKNNNIVFEVLNKKTIIPKEKLPHLFERFYKVDESHSSDGVGLGLSIAKNIVELNGGTISVESEDNIGTTFKVTFNKQK